MTTNQIAYFAAKEQQRHNLAMEQETHRSNVTTETIKLAEQRATETHYLTSDYESIRSHKANESISRISVGEEQRHHTATEAETLRHNTEMERLEEMTRGPQAEKTEAETGKVKQETVNLGAEYGTILSQGDYYDAKSLESRMQAGYLGAQTKYSNEKVRYLPWEEAATYFQIAASALGSAARVHVNQPTAPTYLGGTYEQKEQANRNNAESNQIRIQELEFRKEQLGFQKSKFETERSERQNNSKHP